MFGDKLKELRKNKNMTQEDISKLCNVAKQTISNWESNITQPPFEVVTKLAQYFNVTTDYLLGFDQNNLDKIDKLNKALREAGMVNNDETLKEEEIRLAINQARQYKQMWKRINDLPNKYPEANESADYDNEIKSTNE